MANCQNNMRYGRQGNMYMQRPSWNMQQRNASRMEAERKAAEARREANSGTCGCREARCEERTGCGEELRKAQREERSSCGCREERREERNSCECREERQDCGCREEQHRDRREEKSDCGCGEERRDERRKERSDCGCRREDRLAGMPLAMAYVPWQSWGNLYDGCEALQRGTIFEELDKPFFGRGGCNR